MFETYVINFLYGVLIFCAGGGVVILSILIYLLVKIVRDEDGK